MPEIQKTWWAPVWRGLVVDPAGKHLRFLGKALGLLLYLFLHANRNTGVVHQRQVTIARAMGFPVRTIRGWMRRLVAGGYIRMTGTGRAAVIQIARWRPLRSVRREHAGQTGKVSPIRAAESGHPPGGGMRKTEDSRGEIERRADPNKSISTKGLLQHHGGGQIETVPTAVAKVPLPQSREEVLALDLATGLGDQAHFSRYLSYARTYPEQVLRRLLSEARAVPERDIRRSRAALFTHLLHNHDEHHSPYPRH